jgi:glycosyltransferase involved in cell wall biosynthesis
MALLYGAPAARLAGAAVVHTKHGNNPAGRTRLLAWRAAARWVDAFAAVSPQTADVARRRREVDERRLSVIPNGIALDRFRRDPASRARIRRDLGIDAASRVVGTVGRVAAEKNQALLLRAVAPLLGPGAHLVVAGGGPLLGDLSALAASLGVAPFVHLLGVRADVPDVLNAMDAFVLSSTSEGLPLVVPEAMAVGLPVVATGVGGLPGVVEEGVTGFLVPSGDEGALRARLAMLLADPDQIRTLGERARSTALARFSADRMHRDYVALYERALALRGRPARNAGSA